MSSASTSPRIDQASIAEVPTLEDQEDTEFAGFVHAIVLGVLVGVPTVAVLIAVLVKLAAPDISTAGLIGIVVWVAAWIGVFLGGTVTVGLWSAKQHR